MGSASPPGGVFGQGDDPTGGVPRVLGVRSRELPRRGAHGSPPPGRFGEQTSPRGRLFLISPYTHTSPPHGAGYSLSHPIPTPRPAVGPGVPYLAAVPTSRTPKRSRRPLAHPAQPGRVYPGLIGPGGTGGEFLGRVWCSCSIPSRSLPFPAGSGPVRGGSGPCAAWEPRFLRGGSGSRPRLAPSSLPRRASLAGREGKDDTGAFSDQIGCEERAPGTQGCCWRLVTPTGPGTNRWHSATGLRAGRCPLLAFRGPSCCCRRSPRARLVALEQREPSGHAPGAQLRALALLGTTGALRGAPRRAAGPGTQARGPGTQAWAVAGPSCPLRGHILQNPRCSLPVGTWHYQNLQHADN